MNSQKPIPLQSEVSPCIGVCTLNPQGYCLGCFRHQDEIVAWMGLSFAKRREIMETLDQRAQALFDI